MLSTILIGVGALSIGATIGIVYKNFKEIKESKKKHDTEMRKKVEETLEKISKSLDKIPPDGLIQRLKEKGIIKETQIPVYCHIKDKTGYVKLENSNEIKFTADDYCYSVDDVVHKLDPKTHDKILDILWNAKDGKGQATAIRVLENETRLVIDQIRTVDVEED